MITLALNHKFTNFWHPRGSQGLLTTLVGKLFYLYRLILNFSFIIQIPLRIICICGDAAVRIVSGRTGEVLTTALVPDLVTITDAAYAAEDGKDITVTA